MSSLSNRPLNKDVLIIGAGASGLMCAAECARRGRSVLVFDHADRVCSKVAVSGGGRCNFTNLDMTADHYLSQNPDFCRSALARFTPQDMLALLKKHRISFAEKEAGQFFCARSSRDIVNVLQHECLHAGAEVRLQCRIKSVGKREQFFVTSDLGEFLSDSLVVATGGLSYGQLGATGLGHAIARQFGLKVTELRPGLVPFVFSGEDKKAFGGLAGVSLDAVLRCESRLFRGNILFTHRGLSGPAALQASSYWNKGSSLVIDLLPGRNIRHIITEERGSKMELKTLLARFVPRRFAETWCARTLVSRALNQYSDRELRLLEQRVHAWEIIPRDTEGYDKAEVTRGGVDTKGLSSKTLGSRTTAGLYFIGEVLDVTGHLGGYNLHWAWASGYAAGQFA